MTATTIRLATAEGITFIADGEEITLNQWIPFNCMNAVDLRYEVLHQLYPNINIGYFDFEEALECLTEADYLQYLNENKELWEK